MRAVDAHLGIRSHLDTSSTDANIPLSLGIPAVAIGAGGVGGGAHTTQEWYRPEARDLGLKVPADVSIAGFDDLFFSSYTDPPLTTIRQPKQ